MDNIYLDKILSGDRHAFRYFISTYKDMAFSVAISMVKNELFAEEVVQDSFVEAYLSLGSFKKQAKFSTWFYKIVVRTAYKYRQKNKISDVEFVIEKHDQSAFENIEQQLLKKEQSQIINEALLKIPANESLLLRLFYLEELSVKEIVEITGWTESNSKVILHRARKSLSTVMKGLTLNLNYGS
ncbi:RNA polymerase sigma factor [Sphingobacterium sp. BN32]|uniref:RNA polymerase sigma factor n=1 Tax=Sphingobacterium sp. BN32 TaxID=3058432 RepID=UPI00265D59E7|nr:sigma-70 family RNA polymerase sigma factor [Sphingobacterium sp. BN32]WKK59816.1 sigma-70 family RNA polymerase sigma factor [Sphingobacterium sp. BN32]